MEFSQEFIEKNQLTAEQLTAVNTEVETHVADIKKDWDGLANANAEAIIQGAGKKTIELTGISRNDGEKWADYLSRSSNLYFEGTKSSLQRKEQDLDAKLKSGGGSETLKQELKETQDKLDLLKQKEAQFADYEENDYKGKYQKATEDLTTMQRQVAYSNVKPKFPESVNKFEAEAKWNAFIKTTEEKYDIVLDSDNKAIAIDKENEHKRLKLDELVSKDETISELGRGRTQTGTGSKPNSIKVEGVPFEVPENATPKDRQKAIKEYLASQNISSTSSEYSKRFAELNKKILEKNPTKK